MESRVACLCLLAFGFPASAQRSSQMPLASAVKWELVHSQTAPVDEVRSFGGEPAIEREYGVQSIEQKTYQQHYTTVEVIVERAPDASYAYGLLTYYRTPNPAAARRMPLTVIGPNGALMARGKDFIRVTPPKGSRVSDREFRALIAQAGGAPPSPDSIVALPMSLPAAGLVAGSEKYLVGPEAARRALPSFRTDLIGFSRGAEVEIADYWRGKTRATVLAIIYPNPQIARLQFGVMEKVMGVNEEHGAESLRGRRVASFVFLVLNSDSALTANKLLEQFNVSNSVSWDRPYPGKKPFTVQMMELILANVVFILMLIVLAVAGGIMIVVFRRTMAKLFPDSMWGHQGEDSIITLGLR